MTSRRPVQLTAPAERNSVRLARLVASGVGADAGFSIDDTEDLRIAVSELVSLLVDGIEEPDRSIVVTYRNSPGEVSVEGESQAGRARPRRGASGPGGDPAAPDDDRNGAAVDDLALEILRVVVDAHSFESDDTGRRFSLLKRARPGA